MSPSATRHSNPNVRRRVLTVQRITDVTPRYRRITLTGDRDGFSSPGADDHARGVFPHQSTLAYTPPTFALKCICVCYSGCFPKQCCPERGGNCAD